MFKDFNTIRPSELVNNTGVVPVSVPDHSFISWSIDIPVDVNSSSKNTVSKNQSIKYDVSNIQDNFLQEPEIVSDLHNTVFNLEASLRTQHNINNAYNSLCNNIKKEMSENLNKCKVKIGNASSNKRRKIGKPWWNENLTCLWNEVCNAEKLFLNCNNVCERKRLRVEFVKCRKLFNRNVQKHKRLFWFNLQNDLLDNVKNNSGNFWKSIGKIGVAFQKKHIIPIEILNDDGNIVTDKESVLNKWKNSFSNLYNSSVSHNVEIKRNNVDVNVPEFDNDISIDEVYKAIFDAKKNKACGIDEIPAEIFRNNTSVSVLHILFNVCYSTGIIPTAWGKGIVNPIPKSATNDPRDPLSYRGITLAPSMYKLYCFILNKRVSLWTETNNKTDEQNGFRKKKSTTDHLSSLTNIIETRIKKKLSTFAAFVDFRKAYDTVNRNILWN